MVATKTYEYWCVEVRDPGDTEAGIAPYVTRLKFDDATEAWACWAAAVKAGFQADAEHVKREQV